MKKFMLCMLLALGAGGCIHTQSDVEVKPIHVIIDVNVRVQVDDDLEDMFSDLDDSQSELTQGDKK